MKQLVLSRDDAKKIILHAAGLARPAQFGTGPEAVYQLINHLGYLQLDTNYVVERAHHHVIATRVPDYQTEWLSDLEEDARVFEFFTSDAGYIPMHDYRFSLPVKQAFTDRHAALAPPEFNAMEKVLDRIARDGPMRVKDFENDRTEASSGWWDWRPSKMALERLYMEGKLMITRGPDFHKRYDLPLNLLPADTDQTMPSPVEFARHVIRRNLRSLGIAASKEMAWRARFVKNNLVKKELEKLVEEGEVCQVAVEGLGNTPLYMLPGMQKKKLAISGSTFILSPFDPLNVFRHRLKQFFDFDYQVECFVPEAKRKYGYFSLPVLSGGHFIARMDAKAERKQQILLVHNLHFEPLKLNDEVVTSLADAIAKFAAFNRCREVNIARCNHKPYAKAIKAALK